MLRINWTGCDLVEQRSAADAGISVPDTALETQARIHLRRILRGRILHALDVSRAFPLMDTLLVETVSDPGAPLTIEMLRCELQYLAQQALLTITERHGNWCAQITHQGTDVSEGTVSCPAGIAPRPECSLEYE